VRIPELFYSMENMEKSYRIKEFYNPEATQE